MTRISKYHGLGNDFVLCDYNDVQSYNLSQMALDLCDRHTGIGADGLIIVKQNPLEMIYYNSDGTRAEMCGNGIRCFSKYVHDNNITDKTMYDVLTLAGIMKINVLSASPFIVEVNMGKESYVPEDIPVVFEGELQNHTFDFDGERVTASSLLLGVPHTTVEVDQLDTSEMVRVGKLFEQSPIFNEGTNVNFYRIEDNTHISMQTYERGAGLTLACGTGACATFAQLNREGKVDNECTVSLPLGELTIRKHNDEIYMSGPAVKVFECIIDEEEYSW